MTGLTTRDAATTTNTTLQASRVGLFDDVADMDSDIAFDFMNSDMIRTIHNLPALGAVEWRKGLSLTALSRDYYNTVSWYWIFLVYNGFVLTQQIPPGATLNIPDVTTLRNRLPQNRRGTIVTI